MMKVTYPTVPDSQTYSYTIHKYVIAIIQGFFLLLNLGRINI